MNYAFRKKVRLGEQLAGLNEPSLAIPFGSMGCNVHGRKSNCCVEVNLKQSRFCVPDIIQRIIL